MTALAKQQPELPVRGMSSESIRLTYPGVWHSERAAQRFARDNGLDTAGATVVEDGGRWRIAIDSYRTAMITPWLRQQFPGVLWAVSWTLKETGHERREFHACGRVGE